VPNVHICPTLWQSVQMLLSVEYVSVAHGLKTRGAASEWDVTELSGRVEEWLAVKLEVFS
jgi:hypothetical protein